MENQTTTQDLLNYSASFSPTVRRVNRYFRQQGKALQDSRVLVMGIGCGQNMRHCSSKHCTIRSLRSQGALVDFYDPRITEYECEGMRNRGLGRLTPATLRRYDLVVLDSLIPGVDYPSIINHARCVLDAKSSLRPSLSGYNIIHPDLPKS